MSAVVVAAFGPNIIAAVAEATRSEPKHAKFGPSSLKSRELCPGWRNDSSSDTSRADEGTMLHLAVETGELPATLTDEQKHCVDECLKFCAVLEKDALEVYKEVRLSICGGLTFGTSDRVIIKMNGRKKIAHVPDFKFGYNAIDDAEENRQGMAYAVGVFEKFDVEEVYIWFVIPRRDEILYHIFTRADVARLELIVRTIIARCEEFDKTGDNTMLRPSEAACLYCGRKGKCEAVKNYALTISQNYATLEVVDNVHSSQITDPEKMARAFTLARIMEKWAESVKKHALEMHLNGGELPGYEIRERAATREINNPILALPVLREYLDQEEIVACAKLSLSKMEKIVSDKAEKGKKSKAVGEFNRKLLEAECVTNGEPTRFLQRSKE